MKKAPRFSKFWVPPVMVVLARPDQVTQPVGRTLPTPVLGGHGDTAGLVPFN